MFGIHKKHLFIGGVSSEVWSTTFHVMIRTGKDDLLKREAPVIYEIQKSGKWPSNYKPLVKILYEDSASKTTRLEWHGKIVEFLKRQTLRETPPDLKDAFSELHGHLLRQVGIETIIESE